MPQPDRTYPSSLSFSPVVGTRPADEIAAQIREHLLSRRLRAGDRLPSERKLAVQFGVSCNSVRQALRALSEMGLIEVRKGAAGGAFVLEGGGKAVVAGFADLYSLGTIRPEHLTEARVLLGSEVVRMACMRGTEDELDALEDNIRLSAKADEAGDIEQWIDVNLQFNTLLANMTRNPILVTMTEAINALTEQFVREIGPLPTRIVLPQRRKLLRELRARNCEQAVNTMRAYLQRVQRFYSKAASK